MRKASNLSKIYQGKQPRIRKKERPGSQGGLSEDSNRIVIRQSFTNSNWKNLGPPTLSALANETAHLALQQLGQREMATNTSRGMEQLQAHEFRAAEAKSTLEMHDEKIESKLQKLSLKHNWQSEKRS